jgi:serine/threonine protein phosphatase PrpC
VKNCNHKYIADKIFPSDVRNSLDLDVAFPKGLSLNLSRALGDNAYKPYGVIDTPSVFSLAAVPGKTRVIVVSSDGCGDMLHYYATAGVHENDMWKIVKENFGNPDATARALVDAAKVATDKFFGATGQQDNITVAVIYVTYP